MMPWKSGDDEEEVDLSIGERVDAPAIETSEQIARRLHNAVDACEIWMYPWVPAVHISGSSPQRAISNVSIRPRILFYLLRRIGSFDL